MHTHSDAARLPALAVLVLSLWSPFPASDAAAQERRVFPRQQWETATPSSVGLDEESLHMARDYAISAGGSGLLTRHGIRVLTWGNQQKKYDLKSSTKSIGVTALGLAIDDAKLALADHASMHHPSLGRPPESNRNNNWLDQITIRQLANQSAGFEKPGGYGKLLFSPGTRWHYSDGGPNWLAECVTLAMQQDIESLMFARVLSPIGVTKDDLHWRRNQYREPSIGGMRRCEFGAGVHANVDAMARVGLLYLSDGNWDGKQLLSQAFIEQATRPEPTLQGLSEWSADHGNASEHYGLLWWNNGDGTLGEVPRDAYWSWGLYDSLIVVIPSLDLVVARAGKSWPRKKGQNHYDVLRPFLLPICRAVQAGETATPGQDATPGEDTTGGDNSRPGENAPYPPSELGMLRWDPPDTIRRLARGSDNWPITWIDDGDMLTAYGDGWGFAPKVESKLSMGFARITGSADGFQGVNVRSSTGERFGQGAEGVKASGMLMVDGIVYLLARNADNATLAWSEDHGVSWHWSDWRLTTSFGCPSFVNHGRNHDGVIDEKVYIVSPDSDTAYKAADQMVLARVHQKRIRHLDSYEYFAGTDAAGEPIWSRDPSDRSGIFHNQGRCYRGGMSYCASLQRYLWCQVLPESRHPQGPRFEGGFGVYDAPHPWGPWTTLFFSAHWDVGPGESSSFPVKWMGPEGRSFHLLFSGEDAFSVRRATLESR